MRWFAYTFDLIIYQHIDFLNNEKPRIPPQAMPTNPIYPLLCIAGCRGNLWLFEIYFLFSEMEWTTYGWGHLFGELSFSVVYVVSRRTPFDDTISYSTRPVLLNIDYIRIDGEVPNSLFEVKLVVAKKKLCSHTIMSGRSLSL